MGVCDALCGLFVCCWWVIVGDVIEDVAHELCAFVGEHGFHVVACGVLVDGACFLGENIAAITAQACFHDGASAHIVTGHHGASDRRCAAPTGKQGGMDIETSIVRHV